MLNYEKLPEHMQPGARGYIEKGLPPGGFLRAVLENDLVGAFAKADEVNTREMYWWAEWLYNEAPSACWGSPEKVTAWINHEGLQGREAKHDG